MTPAELLALAKNNLLTLTEWELRHDEYWIKQEHDSVLIPLLERMVELEKLPDELHELAQDYAELKALAEAMGECLKHYELSGYIVKQWQKFKEGKK